MAKKKDLVLVRYVGGSKDEDEWIPEHSHRFRWRIKGIATHRQVTAKNNKQTFDYRVQWVGYNSSHDSWIRHKDLVKDSPQVVREYWQQQQQQQQQLSGDNRFSGRRQFAFSPVFTPLRSSNYVCF